MGSDLQGREHEMRWLRHQVRAARAGVLVRGPAGIGKSRLVQELVRATTREARVAWVRGSHSRSPVPLGVFDDLLDGTSEHRRAGDAAGVADRIREQLGGDGRRSVLVAEDVHTFDEVSIRVLGQLVAADDVTVVGTMRTEEEAPPEVAAVIEALEALDLGPLADADVRALAEELAGGPLGDLAAARIQGLAAGNPLFAGELALDALARGTLQEDRDGVLRLAEPLEPPAGLASLLRSRFDRLDPEDRRALELVAIAQPLPWAAATRLASAGAFSSLRDAQLIQVHEDDGPVMLWTAHPLVGEVAMTSMEEERRRSHCRELIDAMRGRADADPVRVAQWHRESAEPPDGELLLAGAASAVSRFDAVLAESLARSAVEAGAGPDATLVLGESLAAQPGRAEEADAALAELEEAADDEALQVRVTATRARNLLFGMGRPDLAMEVAGRIEGEIHDPSWRAELRAVLGLSAMLLGDVGTAAAVGDGVEAGAGVDPRSVVTVRVVATLGRVMLGRLEGTEELLDEAEELLEGLTLEDHLALAGLQLGLTRSYLDVYAGRIGHAHDRATRRIDEATDAGQDGMVALWLGMQAHAELLRGDLESSVQHGSDADALLVVQDLLRVRAQGICQRGVAAAWLGRREEVVRAVEQAHEVEPAPPPRVAVHVGRLEACLDILDGRIDQAVGRLLAAGRTGLDGQHPVWAAFVLYEAVRVGRADAVVDILEAVAADLDAELVRAMAQHARAAVEGDASALEAAADRLAACGVHLHAAEALLDAADRHEALGDDGRATALRVTAQRMLPDGGSEAWTVRDRFGESVLTEREREIADLAGTGLTSRQIADRLVVSRRTVDNHLAVVYRKLGISGRRELRRPEQTASGRDPS